jgi:hypothetical protein
MNNDVTEYPDNAIPLWIDEEEERSIFEEKYATNDTIELQNDDDDDSSIRLEAERVVAKGDPRR